MLKNCFGEVLKYNPGISVFVELLFHIHRVFLHAAAPLKSLLFSFSVLVHHIRLKRLFINRKIICSRQTINMLNLKKYCC